MAKYSFEFKKKVVLEYLDGKGGALYLFKIYGLASGSQLRKWINAYNAFGDEGLMRSRKQIKYWVIGQNVLMKTALQLDK